MSQEQINIKMESETIAKLRKYFPGEIGNLLEKKAREAIAEMEDPPKQLPKKQDFQIYEDGPYICYAPQKFMDRAQYMRLTSIVPDSVPITSELVISLLAGKIQAWQSVPSVKGTWPGKIIDPE